MQQKLACSLTKLVGTCGSQGWTRYHKDQKGLTEGGTPYLAIRCRQETTRSYGATVPMAAGRESTTRTTRTPLSRPSWMEPNYESKLLPSVRRCSGNFGGARDSLARFEILIGPLGGAREIFSTRVEAEILKLGSTFCLTVYGPHMYFCSAKRSACWNQVRGPAACTCRINPWNEQHWRNNSNIVIFSRTEQDNILHRNVS